MLATVLASVTLVVTVTPTAARAASDSGFYGETTITTWKNYGTVRFVTSAYSPTKVAFDPTSPHQMLQWGSNAQELQLRLLNANGSVLSSPQHWIYAPAFGEDDQGLKNIMTGLAVGYSFRMSAYRYYGYNSDNYFGGTLYW